MSCYFPRTVAAPCEPTVSRTAEAPERQAAEPIDKAAQLASRQRLVLDQM